MPETAVVMAFVSPPLAWPGLGLKVSNWLGPALHPEENARHAALPQFGRLGCDQIGPVEHAPGQPGAQSRGGNALEKIAPAENAVAVDLYTHAVMQL